MNVFKIVFPDSGEVHTYETGFGIKEFVEHAFGGVEAMLSRGVRVLHEDFEALVSSGLETAQPEPEIMRMPEEEVPAVVEET